MERIQNEKQVVFAVTYTYTGYPMIRQMKHMIAEGTIGNLQKVDLQYYQGWIDPVDILQRTTQKCLAIGS